MSAEISLCARVRPWCNFPSKGACICSSHCSGSLIEERISFPPSAKRLGANRCIELAVRAKLTMKVAQFWSKSIEAFFSAQWLQCIRGLQEVLEGSGDTSHRPGPLWFHEPSHHTVICRKAAHPLAAEGTLLVLQIQAQRSHAPLSLSCTCLPSKKTSAFHSQTQQRCSFSSFGWAAGEETPLVVVPSWSCKCPPRANEHASRFLQNM